MNLAIVIGVSDYEKEQKLPACKADATLIHSLLTATGKYSEILPIHQNTSAGRVKDDLRNFFAKHQGKEIDEVFFYFSGHGSFHAALDDVLLCCSDFDSRKAASTSVTNGEVDDLLRSVSPKLAVKVYDACNSGAQYIKDAEAMDSFEKALRDTKLGAFYFMASSKLDQSSFASEVGSHFTSTLVAGALASNSGNVLYRDIQAFIADSFVDKAEQTPFFVTQGTGLEIFAPVTPKMLELQKRISGKSPGAAEEAEHDGEIKQALTKIIADRDSLFVSEGETNKALETAKNTLAAAKVQDALVRSFYKLSVNFEGKLESLPNIRSLAEWASEGNRQRIYFVQVKTRRERIEPNQTAVELSKLLERIGGTPTVNRGPTIKTVPVSLSATRPLPYEITQITLQPIGHPALRPHGVLVGFLHSRMELLVLSSPASFVETGWDQFSVDVSSIKWQQDVRSWKDVIDDPNVLWKDALDRLETQARKYLDGFVPVKVEAKTEVVPKEK